MCVCVYFLSRLPVKRFWWNLLLLAPHKILFWCKNHKKFILTFLHFCVFCVENSKCAFSPLFWILDDPTSPRRKPDVHSILYTHENRVRNVFLVTFFIIFRTFRTLDDSTSLKHNPGHTNVTKNTFLTRFSWSRPPWKAERIGFPGKLYFGHEGCVVAMKGHTRFKIGVKMHFLNFRAKTQKCKNIKINFLRFLHYKNVL